MKQKPIHRKQQGNVGMKNGMWKGNKVSYRSLHNYVRYNLEMPEFCKDCGENKKLEVANISQEYKRDLEDWEWLCRRCHMKKDGRLFTNKHAKHHEMSQM